MCFSHPIIKMLELKNWSQMIKITQLKKKQGTANVCKQEDCLSYPTLTKSDVCRVFFLLIAAQHNLSSDDGSIYDKHYQSGDGKGMYTVCAE